MEKLKRESITTKMMYNGKICSANVNKDGDYILEDGTVGRFSKEEFEQYVLPLLEAEEEDIEEVTEEEKFIEDSQPEDVEVIDKKGKKLKVKKEKGEKTLEEVAKKKKRFALLTYIASVAFILIFAKFFLDGQQRQVDVVRLRVDRVAGDVLTEDNIEKYSMLKKEYEEEGVVDGKDKEGNPTREQIIVLWEDRDTVLNKYVTSFSQSGQKVTTRNVTDKTVIRNPWIDKIDPTFEIYTLEFEEDGINNRLIAPGTHMRVRGTAVGKKDKEGPKSDISSENSAPVISIGENEMNDSILNKLNRAEVVFNDLVTVDMLNSQGESIFEIYMALLKLPLEERISYLETKMENDKNITFQERVTPKKLVFALSSEQATAMTSFETLTEYEIKYTILPYKDDNGQLIDSLVEITNELNEYVLSEAHKRDKE